jgi:hypothetical protein
MSNLIYTLRFSQEEALSFYHICREIVLLEQKGISEHVIEISLTHSQFDSLKPLMDMIFIQPDVLRPGILGYFSEIPIRLLET